MTRALEWIEAHAGQVLAALIGLTIAVRLLAWLVLQPEVASDAQAYFLMAQAMAQGATPVDQFGQHAFFSVGYPLVLAPAFALLGATPFTGILVNLLLASLSAWLIHAIARSLGLTSAWRLLAVLVFALWVPGIWNGAHLARENLSTPMLLAVAWLALTMLDGRGLGWKALLCGLAYGLGVLAGGSAILLIGVPALALLLAWWREGRRIVTPALALCLGAALCLAPWAFATQRMVGEPVLNTNGGFNLYLGNNPAATGRFVSIADTPMGDDWEQLRVERGEVGASRELGALAKQHMIDHPVETLTLSAKRLALFWAPNVPSAQDVEGSRAMLAIRSVEVLQYLLLLALGLVGAFSRRMASDAVLVIAATILGFWAIHGITYNIVRYRDPVMPVVIVLASVGLRDLIARFRQFRWETPRAATAD